MCWRCQEKQNCQLKDGLKKNKHSERKIVFVKNVIKNEIRDRNIEIQSTASLLFVYDAYKAYIVRLMQLNCQLKKIYSLNIWLKHLLLMENILGFFIVHQNFVQLFQLQKTKQWLKTRILGNRFYFNDMVLNQKEDLLIISGDRIYFLEKQNKWNIVQIIQEKNTIYNLSLNNDTNLICKSFKQIFILQKNQNRWELLQRIDFLKQISQALVFFITDEIFVFYRSFTKEFDIYKLNEMKTEFTNTQQVRVYGNYTKDIKFCFIHELNLLVAINGRSISTFEIKENGHIDLKKIFTWNRSTQSILKFSKNFLVTKFLSEKRGIVINKMKVSD